LTDNYWASVVYVEPPLDQLERCDERALVEWVSRTFPFRGSKIDWERAPGRHLTWTIADGAELMSRTAQEVHRRIPPGSAVEHVGDALSPWAARFGGPDVAPVVEALLEIPEHHYFVDIGRAWLVVVSTEGDLDVVDGLGSG
jgi:hypothetical protein